MDVKFYVKMYVSTATIQNLKNNPSSVHEMKMKTSENDVEALSNNSEQVLLAEEYIDIDYNLRDSGLFVYSNYR